MMNRHEKLKEGYSVHDLKWLLLVTMQTSFLPFPTSFFMVKQRISILYTRLGEEYNKKRQTLTLKGQIVGN